MQNESNAAPEHEPISVKMIKMNRDDTIVVHSSVPLVSLLTPHKVAERIFAMIPK